MTTIKKIAIIIISIFTYYSCTSDKAAAPPKKMKDIATNPTNSFVDTCTQNITYSKYIIPLINKACALSGCHVSNGYIDFSTYGALKSYIDSKGVTYFISRIQPNGGMPPSYSSGPKSLSSCEVERLETWLNEGYPNN